ncbi:MAG: hypothetical protein JWO75_2824 [Actinomycetia bacterium]|nr:hypothetical protein [Actinomycetes bacterium]
MTQGTELGAPARAGGRPMSFSVDGWDPSYGASLELEGQLEESTARIDAEVELPADRWRPIDQDTNGRLPEALLFVDGVRRVEAQVWIDDTPRLGDGGLAVPADGGVPGLVNGGAAGLVNGGVPGPADGGPPAAAQADDLPGEATAALCASYAAGVVCCCAAGAHLVVAQLRRGLFSVAPHASDILTRAGGYKAHHVTVKRAGAPVMTTLSQSLQGRLAEVEAIAAAEARGMSGDASPAPGGHPGNSASDLLIVDGPLRGRERLPRALGYIKSHHATYLPPELNALVGTLAPGQRTPAFHMGTSWDRHSWYLRLPGPSGAPWSGVVRIECAADLPVDEVTRLAGLSQRSLGRFASASYKDSRAPQNLYPIAGLERELRRRLGDPRLLYRALREAARTR